jgi:hypothetical protein
MTVKISNITISENILCVKIIFLEKKRGFRTKVFLEQKLQRNKGEQKLLFPFVPL